MTADVREVWRVHDEINLFLIERMPEEGFQAVTLLKGGRPSTGRNVARMLAHMHEVRRSHLGRELLKGVPRFETGATPGREELLAAFRACGAAMGERLARLAESGERFRERPGLILLGYLIAHDSQHRGQILLALKQSGVRAPEEFRFGIWEHWGRPKLPVRL